MGIAKEINMEWWNYLAGGALFGVVAACWDKIKAAVWRVAKLFVQQVEITTEEAHEALVAYLIAHYPRSRIYGRIYGAEYECHRDGRYGLVPYEQFGTRTMIFWSGWWPFVFRNEVEQRALNRRGSRETITTSDEEIRKIYSTLTYLHGRLDVEPILSHACADSNRLTWAADDLEASTKSRFVIHHIPRRESHETRHYHGSNGLAWYQQGFYRLLAHKPEQLGKAPLAGGAALENLIFPERIKRLIHEIELWRRHRDWYTAKGIPWKRGWLLYGPPGTGKTALARAFAEDLNLPIYIFNLAQVGNLELMDGWREMQVNVPCVALIEDIDNVFHGRKNVARPGSLMPIVVPDKKNDPGDEQRNRPFVPLTFDCLLNCLDGVERSEGIFTIITTNDITKVDPALGQPRKLPDGTVEFISTRPGRVDKAVELSYMEADDKKLMAKRILGDYPSDYKAMVEFIDRFPDLQDTPAQFQERCGQIALARFWKEHGEMPVRAALEKRLLALRERVSA
jgi:hypothetical protein